MTQPTVAGWVSTEFRRTPWGGGDDEALLPRRLSGSPAASAVADAEDVAGIERAFHRARQLEPGLGMDLRQEPLPDLADAVMVRQRSAVIEDHLPQRRVYFFVVTSPETPATRR